MDRSSHLLAPLGAWRTRLVWRLFGVVSALSIVLLFGRQENVVARFLSAPPGFHALLVCGILLAAIGPRPWLLALVAIASPAAILPIVSGAIDLMVGDEYLVLMILPSLGLLLAAIVILGGTGPGFVRRMDAAQVGLFRITGLTASFFAAFHKINGDFFDPEVSCATGLALFLDDYWQLPFPAFVTHPSPLQILLIEALVPLLLVAVPRIGILYTAVMLAAIGHIGPAPFTLLLITMACSFFRPQDGPLMAASMRRIGGWIAVPMVAVAAVSFLSYRGEHFWLLFLVEEWVVLPLVLAVLSLLTVLGRRYRRRFLRRSTRRRTIDAALFRWAGPGLGGTTRAARALLVLYLGLSLFNGVTPYLGVKFRFSYAMLSNLRVDTARWNSWIVPRAIYPRRYDPFVHVSRFTMSGTSLSDETMQVGLISPHSLRNQVEKLRERELPFDIELTYVGEDLRFEDASNDPAFNAWLEELPDHRLLQAWLPDEGPQPCLH